MRAPPSPRAALALALIAAFTVWITWRAKTIESSLSGSGKQVSELDGKPAPAFRLASLDGRAVSTDEFRGKKLVVGFWASWCGPCRMELPVLARFYRQTHTADAGYEVVAIDIDDDRAAAEAAATELKLPFAVLLDADGKVSKSYGVDAIPALFVIDENGKVVRGEAGFEFALAQELGIKNYSPTAGAANDSGSH